MGNDGLGKSVATESDQGAAAVELAAARRMLRNAARLLRGGDVEPLKIAAAIDRYLREASEMEGGSE